MPLAEARSVVGTSGTVKTLAAAMLDLPVYDRDAIDGAVLGTAETREYVERLVAMTRGASGGPSRPCIPGAPT